MTPKPKSKKSDNPKLNELYEIVTSVRRMYFKKKADQIDLCVAIAEASAKASTSYHKKEITEEEYDKFLRYLKFLRYYHGCF